MSGTVAMALLAALAPSRLAAQPPAALALMRGPSLFISPSGQPFRAAAGQPYPVVRWFAQVDKKGDGRIDRAEFRADAEAFFHTLDANHDGVIDPFELQAYENQVVPEILGAFRVPGADADASSQGGPPIDRPGPRGLFGRRKAPADPGAASVANGAAPFELIPDPEPIEAADLAVDGHITLAEFLTVVDRRFDRLDKKGLGYLTLADLPKPLAQTAGEQPRGRSAGSPRGAE
ncbi:MAG TPA: hypothetical protein VE309_13665 [Caulobacteraceae bacterium]|nr:hypothetical protein [Caulobacteraceae bacterium]